MGDRITVALLTEDTYAPAFIEGVIKRLIELKVVNSEIYICKGKDTYRKIQLCTDKMRRIIKNIIDKCDKILIFQDADGRNREEVYEEVRSHLKELNSNVGKKIFIIIFDEEIEEWILHNVHKPSDVLKRTRSYEKYQLPNYLNEVSSERIQNLRSFKDFLCALQELT
ncbi:hypothetical protein [Sulfurisphaera tokodaii]|uniref:DUF4276 family protein n=2 Tax=Sulfurisphaera tokodaii TaxID=111955 RepID=Q96Z92_SULTO|nr:hypothetical protein [Sulfurisphaera tokodaii]BAB67034.1 hypothetical protein STK_19400 [Sulfurisphaera tokodaii str. 7]HII74473.1 hypothetical protein [Sulfurisphaera tokodaii]